MCSSFHVLIGMSEIVFLVQNVKPANSAAGTTPSPREAVRPFNFSGDSRSYTMLEKRVGIEQRKVTLANDHTVQMWASRDMRDSKIKH